MKRFVKVLAFTVFALGIPVARAEAQASKYYTVCGGSYAGWTGFALCASVNVTVTPLASGGARVTMTVVNLSGWNGSFSGSVFTAIGLDNVLPPSINVVNNSLVVTGPCVSDPTQTCNFSQHWALSDDKATGGGVKVDLLNYTTNGVNYAVASRCGIAAGTTPDVDLIQTGDASCGDAGTFFATLQFDVTGFFDPNETGTLFIKAQAGFNDDSTTCIEGDNCENVPPDVPIPEPITASLFGGGLAAVGGLRYLRRRRKGRHGQSQAD